jgi:hypothetical protein
MSAVWGRVMRSAVNVSYGLIPAGLFQGQTFLPLHLDRPPVRKTSLVPARVDSLQSVPMPVFPPTFVRAPPLPQAQRSRRETAR